MTEQTIGTWFGTMWDADPAVLPVPCTVTSGRDPALRSVDSFVRGVAILGRCNSATSMIGLKVRGDGRPVRVVMDLRLDVGADEWWTAQSGLDPARVRGHRLVAVLAQGRTRQGVLLSRAPIGESRKAVGSRVSFVLPPEDLPEDGLLLIELIDAAAGLPGPAAGAFVPSAPQGLRIDSVEVTPADDGATGETRIVDGRTAELAGLISTGGLRGVTTRPRPLPPHSAFVVLNPPDDRPLTCQLSATRRVRSWLPKPARRASTALNRRLRRVLPEAPTPRAAGTPSAPVAAVQAPWVRGPYEATRPLPAEVLTVRAVRLVDAAPVVAELTVREGTAEVTVPPGGPVLVTVATTDGGHESDQVAVRAIRCWS